MWRKVGRGGFPTLVGMQEWSAGLKFPPGEVRYNLHSLDRFFLGFQHGERQSV